MLFPFASWEHPWWRSGLLQHATAQSSRHLFQIVRQDKRQGWLFFRALDSSDEAAFALTSPSRAPFVSDTLELMLFGDPSPEQLRASVSHVSGCGQFARVFFLDEDEQLRRFDRHAHFLVVVSAAGWAQWNRVHFDESLSLGSLSIEFSTAFRWTEEPDVARFLATPALELWAQLQRQKEDVRSDCAFARRALDLSSEEMGELLVRWNKGTPADLKRVLKAALLSQTEQWEQAAGYDWIINPDKIHATWHRGRLALLDDRFGAAYSPAPDVLRDVLWRVAPHFEPAFDENLLAAHLEAARWRQRFHGQLSIRIQDPSAHDRIEAALFWREWQNSHPLSP